MNTKPRCCPACGHSFIPWGVWKISRWSGVKCPKCSTLLIRNYDIQFFTLIFIIIFGVTVGTMILRVFSEVSYASVIIFVGGAILLFVGDAYTVRLQQAGVFRGVRGYKL